LTPSTPRRRLAIVVQRYGNDVGGGAELHARYIAERLAAHADVRVLTTCARDYVTWRNEFAPGQELVNGIPVERYPVTRERDRALVEFGRRSTQVFTRVHSLDDELQWLDAQGPVSPALVERATRDGDEFDAILAFSLRYHPTYHVARRQPRRTVLVPTVERESAVGLAIFGPVLRGARAIMYNSPEERALLQSVARNEHVPGVVVGVGSDIPSRPQPQRARRRFGLNHPFVLYVGRIDANKGCAELFGLFNEWLRVRHLTLRDEPVDLVLVGTKVMDVPDNPRIRHLGYVTDEDKFDLLSAAAALVMPSYYESLSMVALEAWALGRPVLANARCDVLLGQCLRSNAGLYYRDADEFGGALDAILTTPGLAAAMGERGKRFYREHYDWPVVEGKYLDMLERLRSIPAREPEPCPGRLERRRRNKAPADAVVASVPSGAVRDAGEGGS
jgi:glycosyltransferase involved in cell wall biosynthesis